MGHSDNQTRHLFSADSLRAARATEHELTPLEMREKAMKGTPRERAEFTRSVSVEVDGYRRGLDCAEKLIARAAETKSPGGLWILGDGGTGKTFINDCLIKRHKPVETVEFRYCPVLYLTFESRPSESDVLLDILVQCGQDPDAIRYQNNKDLMNITLEAIAACDTAAALFDEAHHLWLSASGKRVQDRAGGRLGDFLKRFYDKSGIAYIFSGTPGLKSLYDADTQARTRWCGVLELEPFACDEKFVGLLAALDQAIPMNEPAGLATSGMYPRMHAACTGNFRLLKNLLAETVRLAAAEGANSISMRHLAETYRALFCSEQTPFDDQWKLAA